MGQWFNFVIHFVHWLNLTKNREKNEESSFWSNKTKHKKRLTKVIGSLLFLIYENNF
ncbi:hypothetical protein M23134_01755 [Microscilla marina ATCC 23134]|uniref:Uncharacterized protein n=1 Tax=Microscilla marina ATCC 23134 TaxID=313606 RepID=A1ZYX9_MICM2|nr:hypothetical protein M23134_01755 [Microscilla marina ATCC 23134]